MAIIKELDSSFGCGVTYHRIVNVNVDYEKKKIIICLASYLTKEARIYMKDPLEKVDIEVPTEDYLLFVNTNIIQTAYVWLKNNVVGFEDALDDLEVVVEINPNPESVKTEG